MGRWPRGDVFRLPKITCAPRFHALAGPDDNEADWKYFGPLDWMSRSCTIVSNLNYYRNDLLFNYSYCRILSCTVLKKEKLSGKMEAFLNDEVSNYFWRGFTEYLKLKKLQLSTILLVCWVLQLQVEKNWTNTPLIGYKCAVEFEYVSIKGLVLVL